MAKYIDAEKLKAKVKDLNLATKTYEEQVAFINALAMVVEIIDSLQQEQPEIEKEAEISPSMVSNFGPCTFNLSVAFTQEEMAKMNIVLFLSKKVNVIIKDAK